jgi:hypothetical protein
MRWMVAGKISSGMPAPDREDGHADDLRCPRAGRQAGDQVAHREHSQTAQQHGQENVERLALEAHVVDQPAA